MVRLRAYILRYAEPCEAAHLQSDTRCGTQTQTLVRNEGSDSDANHALPCSRFYGSATGTETVTEVKAEDSDKDAIANSLLTAIPQSSISGKETVTKVKGEVRDVHFLRSQYAAMTTCHQAPQCS